LGIRFWRTETKNANLPFHNIFLKSIILKTNKKIQILEIAEKLFCKYGFKETTMRLITSEANISVAMLNYYFGSKENLFLIILETKIKQFISIKEAFILKEGTVSEELLVYTNLYIDLIYDHLLFYKLMMTEKLLNENKSVVDLISSYFNSNRLTLKNIIIQGISQKKIEPIDVETFMLNISGFLIYVIFKTDEVFTDAVEETKMRLKNHLQKIVTSFIIDQLTK
jgi:AcrR family transcriptional regulator